MLNNVMLVGRLVNDIEVQEQEGKKRCYLTLGVNRSFKNADGVYETDFIDCLLWDAVAGNVAEYCKKGDVVGIRGRLQTQMVDDRKETVVVAEKVTFLSSKASTNDDNEEEE